MENTYIILAVLAIIGAWLYVRHRNKITKIDIQDKYMSDPTEIKALLAKKLRRPVLWIFIDYKYNAMKWSSFFSRSSTNMNIPFIDMTVESIINHCSKHFNICLINDNSFAQLLPEWSTNLSMIGDPLKEKVRRCGMISLLCEYGGMMVPSSFLCLKNLEPLYRICLQTHKPVVFENNKRQPNPDFIGCLAGDMVMNEYKSYLQRNLSRDYTDESCFLGDDSKWLATRVTNDKVKIIHGGIIGVLTKNSHPIEVQDIVSINTINYESKENLYGIHVPLCELLKRKEYKWFCYLSDHDILGSKLCIAKYFKDAIYY